MKKQQTPYEEKLNDYNSKNGDKNKKTNQKNNQILKKNPNKIIINVSQTQYPIVRAVAKKFKWNIVTQPISTFNFDLAWIDGHCRQQIFAKMQPYQKINHFPGMEILSRKNFLGRSLMQFKKRFGEQYDFFPLTWNLPAQFADLKEYHENRQQGKAQTFIVKPQASCQGRGIFLTRNIDKLKYQKCVVQRYMSKPMLIEGLKFDLRIYVLVAGTDPLRIFVYNQGLARFCTAPYQTPKTDNLDNKFMHLTNYAINKLSPDFVFNEDAKQCDKGHKRSLSSIYKTLDQLGHNSQQIKQRINDMIIKTIITGYPTLSRMQQSSHPQNFANDMCFQILGFDVILNHKKNPFILQINYTPSFTTDSPFDKHVKKNLIYDALKLLNVNEKWKKQVRKKRDVQIKQRMLSGKRTKYTPQQKYQLIQKHSQMRDQHQAQNLGGFTKIFCKSQEQMLKYAHFYEFAQLLYQKQNKITGVTTSKNFIPFFMPYAKSPKNQISNQFSRTGFSSAKLIKRPVITAQQANRGKSIQNRKIISAKFMPSKNSVLQNNRSLKNEQMAVKRSNYVKQQSKFVQDTPFTFNNKQLKQKLSISSSMNNNQKLRKSSNQLQKKSIGHRKINSKVQNIQQDQNDNSNDSDNSNQFDHEEGQFGDDYQQ